MDGERHASQATSSDLAAGGWPPPPPRSAEDRLILSAAERAAALNQRRDDLLLRGLDLLLSAALIILFAPLLAVIALVVRLDSPGPALFRQMRYGRGGRTFMIYKFRTMTVMETHAMTRQASRDDARITRFGRFLRRTSLDELPQLFNILLGDMSLVGPRPHPVTLDQSLSRRVRSYGRRFTVRPGLTGLAQVRGFRGEILTEAHLKGRVAHDLTWVRRRSMVLYLYILVVTALVVLGQDQAY